MAQGEWPLVGRDREVGVLGSLTRRTSVVVSGDVGVGKSRLVADVTKRAAASGMPTISVRATRSLAAMPFGPFATWVPDDLDPRHADRLQVLRAVGSRLADHDVPLLLVVDDAHLLDEASGALVLHLVMRGAARVLATVRSGEEPPEAITTLWKEELAELVELGALGKDSTLALAGHVLGDRLDRSAARRIWQLTTGTPLYLREVLRAAVEQGVLARGAAGWRWEGELAGDVRLNHLIDANLQAGDGTTTRMLELVAVVEPLPLDLAAELGCMPALEEAEHRRLVGVDDSAEWAAVRMAHPLYGEVLRARLPALVIRRLHAELAEAALRIGWQDQDPLGVASWCLKGDVTPASRAVFLVAAERALALTDWDLAAQLARRAEAAGAGARATLVRAAAVVEKGGWGAADDLLADFAEMPLDDELVGERIRFRASNLVWGHGQTEAGQRLLGQAARQLRGAARARVLTDAAYTSALACSPAESLRLAGEALDVAEPGSDLRAHALAVASLAWTLQGRTVLALRAAETVGTSLDAALRRDPFPGAPVLTLLPAWCGSLVAQGRIDDAVTVAGLVADAETPQARDLLRSIGLALRGRMALFQGRPALALRWGTAALAERGTGQFNLWPIAVALTGAAQLGLTDEARRLLDHPASAAPGLPLYEHELTVARGWLAASLGQFQAAHSFLLAAADAAAGRGARLLEVLALVDLGRLGGSSLAAERLVRLCDLVEGPFVVAAAASARAACRGDGDGLDQASVRFETMGCLLMAAEAAAEAAAAHRDAGGRAAGTRAAGRAQRLVARCDHARTWTGRLGEVDAGDALPTRREREVIGLVAEGLTNRQIAARLCVSVRTVNAHLNHAYTKLGTSDRTRLTDLL